MSTNETCPCGSGQPYTACCEPLHQGNTLAATAEALMRSRYSAFVRKHSEYLINTRHPDKRHMDTAVQLEASFRGTNWLGLTVLKTEKGQAEDDAGHVTFAARYDDGQGENTLFERSLFRKQGGRWFYVEGDFNIGRNVPCWCGSGKKFKKCHGK